MIHEIRSESKLFQESAVKPDRTQCFVIQDLRFELNRQEAPIECQEAEVISLQSDSESTQDSLNKWDEVNRNSVRGVYVDNSFGTSTSPVSRVTEPAISHLVQAGTKIGCSAEYSTGEHLESCIGSSRFIYSNDFFAE